MGNATPGAAENGSLRLPALRDPRLDRAVTWALTTAAALMFGAGAHEFNALVSEVRAMRADLTEITTRMAVLEAAHYGEQIRDLEQRVRALEQKR